MRSLSILLIAILLCSCRGSRVTEFPQNEDQVKQDEVKSEVRVGNSASAIASELNARWRQLLETNPSELLPWVEYVIAYSRQQDSEADHLAGVWEKIADRFPNDSDVLRQTARALRMVGRSSQALVRVKEENRKQLDPIELADLLLESGELKQAAKVLVANGLASAAAYQPAIDEMFQQVLQQVPNEAEQCAHKVQLATVTFAFVDNWSLANELSNLYLDRVARIRRVADLRIMNRLAPNEPMFAKAIQETQDLNVPFVTLATTKNKKSSTVTEEEGSDLKIYQKHCAQCHGENGDSRGTASRFLYPPPRSFVAEPMRYISHLNHTATDGDIRRTIIAGLAGTSMPAFKQLSEVDLERLVRQIRRFQSQKLPANRPPNEALAEVDEPDWKVDPTAIVEEGKHQFVRFGCAGCHRTSHEAESRVFADLTGQPVRARDFLTEPLRLGSDPQEILLRIVVGMPGTPHPQLSVADTDLRPLVFYIRSLLPNEYPSSTNHSRRLSVTLQR